MQYSKYVKWYENLITHAKQNKEIIESSYYETHHILPKCLNGTDSVDNLVSLTARQHFVAHWILTRIYKNSEAYTKLLFAFNAMTRDRTGNRYYSGKGYEIARKLLGNQLSKERKGNWTIGEDNAMHGKSVYERWVELYGEDIADKKMVDYSNKMKESTTGEKNGFYGKKHSEETRKKLSKARQSTYKLVSPGGEAYTIKDSLLNICNRFGLHEKTLRRYFNKGKIPQPKWKNQTQVKYNTVGWEIYKLT